MDPRKAERRALRWLVVSSILFLMSLANAPFTSSSLPWLLPFSTFCGVVVWFELWRGHRRAK